MSITTESVSARRRARLKHPVIDSDGHIIEFTPAFQDYVRRVGGDEAAERSGMRRRRGRTRDERLDSWTASPPWWGLPTKNTLDRCTASLPALLRERLDDLGMDYLVLYPTTGLGMPHHPDDELRPVLCRAFNEFVADIYCEHADRMTVTAVIPMHTPQEAIAELEHAASLGLKVALIPAYVRRPIPVIARKYPELAQQMTRLDTYGIDSEHDYDPVWAKCVELGMAIVCHSSGMGFIDRQSPTTYMYNHMGHFAAAGEALSKSLFMGGVTRRFPTLRFAFLEGGVAWGCRLYADIIGRWEKRNPRALDENLNPDRLDRELALDLFTRYGGRLVEGHLDEVLPWLTAGSGSAPLNDDFARCEMEKAEDIVDLFVPSFYFGCEADDPMNAVAFNRKLNPFGQQIGAVLGTDIGHWDVPDMTTVVEDAHRLVDTGVIGEEDFRALACDNSIRLYAGINRDFFKGTAVEQYVAGVLAGTDR
jgi:predicted TIM-barrel fold metal-dependent hydrolase